MNPTTEYNANPFQEKELIRYIAFYKLNERSDCPPSPLVEDLKKIPNIELLADICHQFDYRHASYISALYRAIREIQHIPPSPTDGLEQTPEELAKLKELEKEKKIPSPYPSHTHRLRLSHEEFEIHVQTLVLPDIIRQDDDRSMAVSEDGKDEKNQNGNDGDSDNDDESDKDNDNDESGIKTNTTKSRFVERNPEKKISKTSSKKSLSSSSSPKAINLTLKTTPIETTTYILFVVTDYNFPIEYSISSFFKDFTTQLNFIFSSPLPSISIKINNNKDNTSKTSTALMSGDGNGDKKGPKVKGSEEGSEGKQNQQKQLFKHDRRFFILLGQLYNRYINTKTISSKTQNQYNEYIQKEVKKKNNQNNKVDTKNTKNEKKTDEKIPQDEEKEDEKEDEKIEKTERVSAESSSSKPPTQFPLQSGGITLFTTVPHINLPNISTNPRRLHIETVSSIDQLESLKLSPNSPELITFTSELLKEHQYIEMSPQNATLGPQGLAFIAGIPVRWVYSGVMIFIQLIVMALVVWGMHATGLFYDGDEKPLI